MEPLLARGGTIVLMFYLRRDFLGTTSDVVWTAGNNEWFGTHQSGPLRCVPTHFLLVWHTSERTLMVGHF